MSLRYTLGIEFAALVIAFAGLLAASGSVLAAFRQARKVNGVNGTVVRHDLSITEMQRGVERTQSRLDSCEQARDEYRKERDELKARLDYLEGLIRERTS